MRALMRAVARGYLLGLFRVTGLENVPRSGGLLVCPNHRSTIDPPLVPAFLPRSDSWSMSKSEYLERGIVRWIFLNYHAFPVVRHTADRRALRRALSILGEGESLIVYPEGTRVESGVLERAEPGVGFLVQHSDTSVLPMALTGTRECFPKGARFPRRHRVEVVFGKPFRLATRRADGSRVPHQDAADAVMLAISELLPPSLRGAYGDLAELRTRLGHLYLPAAESAGGSGPVEPSGC